MSAKDDALAMINSFETSGRSGVWTNITAKDVVKGLRIRVNDPSKVNQAGSMLCGPAAFVYDLATDEPDTYAKAIIDLFTGGTATIGTLLLKPKTDLLFNHFSGGIDPTDWILMASLRDSSNFLFDVQEVDDVLGVATIPSTMATWLSNAGYSKVVNETNLWYTKDVENLRKASWYLDNQYRVFLFVNSAMLQTRKQTRPSLVPDHWVMLLSAVNITGVPASPKTVSFWAYSWGNEQKVPEDEKVPLSLPAFLSNYYGFIAFKH